MMVDVLQWHKPELAEADGMVYQVWNDAEVTLQKSGSLLWQRNLHCIAPGDDTIARAPDTFPVQRNGYGFIYTDSDGAKACIRAMGSRYADFL